MDGPQTNDYSLLEAVQSHLTLISDSGGSTSASETASASASPLRAGNATDEDKIQDQLALNHELSEPFPDYEDISVDRGFEIAYLRAFYLTMRDQIRTGVVDLRIESPAQLSEKKRRTLNAIKAALANPQLPTPTRERFIALTNMVIRLENALFSEPEAEFLNEKATKDAQYIANGMLTWINWVEAITKDNYNTSVHIYPALKEASYANIPEKHRYLRMSMIVNCSLKNPRPIEQDLLALFMVLFDEWVYKEFLLVRSAQVHHERNANASRIQLARSLHAIWTGLSGANENYANYKRMLITMRDRFFIPSLVRLPHHISCPLPVCIERYLGFD
ncbi:uncharacterized protein N7483_001629 [Penicillium malachiteum]|uniref:uncharacterized protein n=1 Tax=Penicillium malachiteum TaxID=1324776 RepID=UPI002549B009|nr:uncharacterized protein N7483_001629 [Penicillium malachiteum]KAJ5736504.1 hypothetical protein N7483_001629 [Penicillium malachiteum]